MEETEPKAVDVRTANVQQGLSVAEELASEN